MKENYQFSLRYANVRLLELEFKIDRLVYLKAI